MLSLIHSHIHIQTIMHFLIDSFTHSIDVLTMCAFVQDCEWHIGFASVAVRFGSVQSVDESLHCRIRWCLYSAGVSECGCV
jgi:hypothetical protein